MNKTLMTLATCAVAISTAQAVEIEFSYSSPDEEFKVYGFNKKEVYDVAIRITDPVYIGTKVKGFSVPLPADNAWVEDLSGWLTTELVLENKVNAPNIAVKAATLDDWTLSVTFDEPYEITGEGVYVGYSFKVVTLDNYSNYPIACRQGSNPDALYVHSSRTRLKWASISETIGAVSPMVVYLESESGDYAMSAVMPATSYASLEEGTIPVTLINKSIEPATSIAYSYTIGDLTGSATFDFATPVAAGGARFKANIPVDELPALGEYPMTFTVESINGNANTDPIKSASSTLEVLPFIPVTRPLVEEFTGLNCGFCPRGYVAMEQMGEELGDMFVGMAYHSVSYESGCMVVLPDDDFPIYISGLPSGTIDRVVEMDPGNFQDKWAGYQDRFAPASVDAELEWADDSKTSLIARVRARFARPVVDGDYKLSVALVADGLKNSKWFQSNYYKGEEGLEGPLWDIFTKGGSKVAGLTFNDVVVYYKDVKGVEGSVPSSMAAGEEVEYECVINVVDIVNNKNEQFVNEDATLHAVGVLIDGVTGQSVNCNRSASVGYATGVGELKAGKAVATEWYDLNGMQVAKPAAGIYVKVVTLENGDVVRSKVCVNQ